ETLKSLIGLTDDIVVYDNGSTDGTIETIRSFPVQLHTGAWEGFGKTKRMATALAKHDWVLSLDADEAIDSELKESLLKLDLKEPKTVYELKFRNYFGKKH